MNGFQMFPDAITKGIPELIQTMKEFNKTSSQLQKKLTFWTKVMAIATIGLLIFAGLSIYYSSKTSSEAFNVIKDITPSKSAYIEIKPTVWAQNTIYEQESDLLSQKEIPLSFTIQNTGRINTSRISIIQRYPENNFHFNNLNIDNLPDGSSIQRDMNLTLINKTGLIGEHKILLQIYCTNCLEQDSVLFKEIKIIVYK